MKYHIVQKEKEKYLELFSRETPIGTERDALELVALCGENDVSRLMLHSEALSGDFFSLRTGAAGAVLQKLINYSVKTAIIAADLSGRSERFSEFVSEANRGGQYRFFENAEKAEQWLLK